MTQVVGPIFFIYRALLSGWRVPRAIFLLHMTSRWSWRAGAIRRGSRNDLLFWNSHRAGSWTTSEEKFRHPYRNTTTFPGGAFPAPPSYLQRDARSLSPLAKVAILLDRAIFGELLLVRSVDFGKGVFKFLAPHCTDQVLTEVAMVVKVVVVIFPGREGPLS